VFIRCFTEVISAVERYESIVEQSVSRFHAR